MLSYCACVGNSTVSFIFRVDSESPALTKKASDARTLFSCRTGACGGGRPNYCRSVESYLNVGGCSWGRNYNYAVGSSDGVSPPVRRPYLLLRGYSYCRYQVKLMLR